MKIFSGDLFGNNVDIEYSNKNITITKFKNDKYRKAIKMNYKDYGARNYLGIILSNITIMIRDTLHEMNSSEVIKVGCINIDKDSISGVIDVYYNKTLDIINELLRKYSDYIIKPSLLVDGGLKSNMYSEASIKEFMGVIYDNRKYIIDKVYLIPNSKNNIVHFYFQHYMVMMSTAELIDCRYKAIKLDDNIEDNKNEVALFRG